MVGNIGRLISRGFVESSSLRSGSGSLGSGVLSGVVSTFVAGSERSVVSNLSGFVVLSPVGLGLRAY